MKTEHVIITALLLAGGWFAFGQKYKVITANGRSIYYQNFKYWYQPRTGKPVVITEADYNETAMGWAIGNEIVNDLFKP